MKLIPRVCNYYVTLNCNSRCTFCNIWKQPGGALNNASLSDFTENLVDLKRLGVKFIDLTGGEPLLNPFLPEMLERAKSAGFFTMVTSNGILYPKLAKDLTGLVDELTFSIDAPTGAVHDALRGVPCFDRVVESVELARRLGQKPSIIFTVTDENLASLPEMARFAQKKKVFLIVDPVFSYFGNHAIGADKMKYLRTFFYQPYVTINLAELKFVENGGNDTKNPVCKAIESSVIISPDNHILLPCFHNTVKKLKIEGNLYRLFNSEEVKTFRSREGRFDFCQACTIWCYMARSFFYGFGQYLPLAAYSQCKYYFEKHVVYPFRSGLTNNRA